MLTMKHSAFAASLAAKAVKALTEEALLTPKPGLVDARDNGSHTDMSIDLMFTSARALEDTFREIAIVSYLHPVDQSLREQIALIGREGEKVMLRATNGVNTHKGAIWALGLLTSARAAFPRERDPHQIMSIAGTIASFHDRYRPMQRTNGQSVKKRYAVMGAEEEARLGFPHIRDNALPTLLHARACGKTEEEARIEALLALMASVDDTCILHRGHWSDLITIKRMSGAFLAADGFSTQSGRKLFYRLSEHCKFRRLSPGGSADLLAATLFLID
ncbi:triphosphoribosyl-dephospho-CoA synthase MdcB [Paenibacillus terrae]|uniref:triphosphoribosyl-dephospho-CoA synthase n=1 Tax=Paenibacillus terrae TaxID=159743 RepID=A0A4U2Q917_9BACL|nr:triphosphoribosyl-dephospho-CoA synthase [Paenibacillus terrae]TKH46628.1 triphosphoribosyl-dephospho-CoA synthase MdcB [Paenibacillus terrae]